MRGWVYVLSNRSMPGKVKVGFTTKDPMSRARELDHTGLPDPHQVVYDALVEEPRRLEARTHEALSEYRHRNEWFSCGSDVAIAAIRRIASDRILLEGGELLESLKRRPEQAPSRAEAPKGDAEIPSAYRASARSIVERPPRGHEIARIERADTTGSSIVSEAPRPSGTALKQSSSNFLCWNCGTLVPSFRPAPPCGSCGTNYPLGQTVTLR